MDYGSLVLLIVIHIIFDFVLQSRTIATNKSSSIKYLIPHLVILFVGLTIFIHFSGRYTYNQATVFLFGNVILHGIIDWNIWNLYKFLVIKRFPKADASYKYYEDKVFYDFIALDQGLHALCYLGLDYLARTYV